jgi:hypothetical protein
MFTDPDGKLSTLNLSGPTAKTSKEAEKFLLKEGYIEKKYEIGHGYYTVGTSKGKDAARAYLKKKIS